MRISDWSSDVCSSDLPYCFQALKLRIIIIPIGVQSLGTSSLAIPPLGIGLKSLSVLRNMRELRGVPTVHNHHLPCIEAGVVGREEHASRGNVHGTAQERGQDRKSAGEGESVPVRVDSGGG